MAHRGPNKPRFFSTVTILCVSALLLFSIASPAHAATQEKTDKRATPNKLINAYSPYLKQHAYNPVYWYPWGDEAFAKAQRENKMILLSVGYATCYWCHVMERTVFQDEDIAAYMNEHFVSVKVDREVRPDIDEIYMHASLLLSNEQGWPNNMFLTPNLQPAFAYGTLNKEQWIYVTQNAANIWQSNQGAAEAKAAAIEAALKRHYEGSPRKNVATDADGSDAPTIKLQNAVNSFYDHTKMHYDNRNGGFGTGSKYPDTPTLLYLIDMGEIYSDESALQKAEFTTQNMISGGIHDQVGGGFHRYTIDPLWRIPHFEKMLYNQGLILDLLARLYEKTDKQEYKYTAQRLSRFISNNMTDKNGAFYSAIDAETDATEGAFYVWTDEEIKASLPEKHYNIFTKIYGIADIYRFPGHHYAAGGVLYKKAHAETPSVLHDLDLALAALEEKRRSRSLPLTDKKIITAWNSIMIMGLAEAAIIWPTEDFLPKAEKAAKFILENMMQEDGRLKRVHIHGQTYRDGFLEDYAWLSRALIRLYKVTQNEMYLNKALGLVDLTDKYFRDENRQAYYFSASDDEVSVRIKQGHDTGSLPAANAVMVHLYADLYELTHDEKWKSKAEDVGKAFARDLNKKPLRFQHMVHGLMRLKEANQSKELLISDTTPQEEESSSKVSATASLVQKNSSDNYKEIKVVIEIEDGWYINSNPASLESLIATTVDVQTDSPSTLNVLYPIPRAKQTPLGDISIYQERARIYAQVQSDDIIDQDNIRVLLQVQACKDEICYMPSNIALTLTP